jgi:hypothetical protein
VRKREKRGEGKRQEKIEKVVVWNSTGIRANALDLSSSVSPIYDLLI